ncbi:hypothetical protein K1T71_002808 [Dendrolimus kikuchii]|uniref:Uncharacterized protein n=1 Tax=Dendrolimus kikuchii TaxID=765133 RepID=A0ACC1DEQ0_9NEOP|nr:hypothetical protein K1T71_002808 [Dendrolimus kikuchii]
MHSITEDLFRDPMDPQIINKIRFAYYLPTLSYVRIFYPDAKYIAEKPFQEIKRTMLNWEFSRALFMSPPSVVNKIKGSPLQLTFLLIALNQYIPIVT